jgi:hypothetical protein
MGIYKKNIGYFLNMSFWILLFCFDSFIDMILKMGASTIVIPILFGFILGHWEKDIDWEIV